MRYCCQQVLLRAIVLCFIPLRGLGVDPQFLTLPYSDSNVSVRQGWFYDRAGHFACQELPENLRDRCHKGIDYFCVEDGKVVSFDVLAAADGKAVALYSTTYGNVVFIQHDVLDTLGRRVFTLYAHLEDRSWTSPLKTQVEVAADISRQDFSSWQTVNRGEPIGRAGKTGFASGQIHLHFEIQLGGYAMNKTDPYGIYGTKDYYPSPCTPAPLLPSETTRLLPSSMWTECPPVFPTEAPIQCVGDGGLVARDSIEVQMLSSDAGFISDVYLSVPGHEPIWCGSNRDVGSIVMLHRLPPNTPLQFFIVVRDTGFTFYQGGPELNRDNIIHARVNCADDGLAATVGFEDLFGGGDFDYNDVQIRVAVPEIFPF